jgi:tetratricopeptide (TPR) repeat protein
MSGLIAISPVVRRALAAWVAFCPMLLGIAAEPAVPSDLPANSPITNSVSADSPTNSLSTNSLSTTSLPPNSLLSREVDPGAANTNAPASESFAPIATSPSKLDQYDFTLAAARFAANTHDYAEAEKNFIKLLVQGVPETMRQTAFFELAQTVRSENDLPRAQAIYTQYLQHWPGDPRTPEVYLHQGQVFRDMGLPNLALTKFYGVMTMALSLKNNQIDYYKGIVLQAQVEIAETHFIMGKFKDAVDYYSRLMNQNDPQLDRAQIQFRLIRSLEAIHEHDEAAAQAQDFLAHFPDSLEEPEVRYHLAQAYKGQNRNTEALQQVKLFLKEEHDKTTNNPSVWSYWQQRVGNEIGNELYQEGDYVKALEVYLALSQLDASPAWQLPVEYQVGLTYERLLQPRLAMQAYRMIVTNSPTVIDTNQAPGLKSVMDMAVWRLNFLEWNARAEAFDHPVLATTATNLIQNPSAP